MFDLAREIGQTLRHNKLRTVLTGLAVVWGVFMLIVLLGLSRGIVRDSLSGMDTESVSNIVMYGGRTTKAYKGYREGRLITLQTTDRDKLAGCHNSRIKDVSAQISIDTAVVSSITESVSHGLQGSFPDAASKNRIKIIHGRFINEPDMHKNRRVLVINSESATILFGDAAKAVGQQVRAMGLGWRVVGVYQHSWRRDNYAPYTTVYALRGFNHDVDEVHISMQNVATEGQAKDVENAARGIVAQNHDISPEDTGALWTWNQFESYIMQQTVSAVMNGIVWIIGLLTLLSGIVGVSNIMFVSVRERTHEIGIRRAIGAKPRSILMQVLAESVAITSLFGYIGIIGGILVTELICYISRQTSYTIDASIDLSVAVQVTVMLIIVGGIAGFFPARKATKVSPVEALRDE